MSKPVGLRFGQIVRAIQVTIPESRLPLEQISSIYQKTGAMAWYKDSFEEMEHEFPFGTIRPENQNFLVRCSRNFQLERHKKPCSLNSLPGFYGNVL